MASLDSFTDRLLRMRAEAGVLDADLLVVSDAETRYLHHALARAMELPTADLEAMACSSEDR